MNNIELLNSRYEITLQSERLSDFYMNIHGYVDLILKTPEFNSVVEIEKNRYYSELKKVGRNSTKLERFNFQVAHWLDLYIPIYYPLEDYKTTYDPDTHQDPVALILFYGLDSPQVKEWCKNLRNALSYREGKKLMKSYSQGIDSRKNIERHLRQFHINFLTAYVTRQSTKPSAKKISIKSIPLDLNPRTGDFKYFNIQGNLNPKGKEFKVLIHLLSSDEYFAEYPELINTYKKYKIDASTSLKSELHQVVKSLKEKLGILSTENIQKPDIFENIRNVGYKLIFPT